MLTLRFNSPSAWVDTVLANLGEFLRDHAACERKASATALTFVSHYPDRPELVSAMIGLAQEELQHFRQVYEQLASMGIQLGADSKDAYVVALRRAERAGRENYLLDRLLVGGIVEARGCERFDLLARALPQGTLKDLYAAFASSEARHRQLFLGLADTYFDAGVVKERAEELLDLEGEIVAKLPLRPALH